MICISALMRACMSQLECGRKLTDDDDGYDEGGE